MTAGVDFHTRYDPKRLAALAVYLREQGFLAPTRSMLVSRLLDTLYLKLEEEGLVREITTIEAAEAILHHLGIVGTFTSKRNRTLFNSTIMQEATSAEHDEDRDAKIQEWSKLMEIPPRVSGEDKSN